MSEKSIGEMEKEELITIIEELRQKTNELDQKLAQNDENFQKFESFWKDNAQEISKLPDNLQSAQTSLTKIGEKKSEFDSTAQDNLNQITNKKVEVDNAATEFQNKFNGFINEANKKVADVVREANQAKGNIETSQREIASYHANLLHDKEKTDDDPEERISIKTQIENFKEDFEAKADKLYSQHEENFEKLDKKIEGLLPGATSAGLASSYVDAQNKFKVRLLWFGFIASISSLAGASFYLVSTTNGDWSDLFSKIPVLFPLGWLAWFCQRSISQMKRLSEEYHHKETTMRIYDGFVEQIRKLHTDPLDDSKKADRDDLINNLEKSLIETLLETIRRNPAESLGKPMTPLENVSSLMRKKSS